MGRDQSSPVTWSQVPEMVARFTGVVEADSALTAARKTLELVADLGASEVHLEIQLFSASPIELSWSAEQGLLKQQGKPSGLLDGLREAASNRNVATACISGESGEQHWVWIIWVNTVMARRYGNENRNTLIGAACNTVCRNPEKECENCPVRMVRLGSPLLHQERTEIRDNQTRHLYVSAFPVRAPEGHVNEVLVMLQDITDLETLRRSEARYQLLFERSADAIIMAEPESLEIVMANSQARHLLGINPDADDKPSLLQLHPEAVRDGMEKKYRSLRAGSPLENVEVGVVGTDGELLTCNECGTLFDLDGTEVILIEFRDVTQMRKLQSELARADHLITLGTMNAGIAHEFKNRLAPIRAFAQLITLQRTHLDKLMSHAPLMIEEIDRLSALVRDILDYARPQNPSRVPESFGPLMEEYANEFIGEYQSTIDALGITCECVVPESSRLMVHVDTSQVRRAFLNLFKHRAPGSRRKDLSRPGRNRDNFSRVRGHQPP